MCTIPISILYLYYNFIWVIFVAKKDEAFPLFTRLARKVQNEKSCVITYIRSDYGRELVRTWKIKIKIKMSLRP